jgi:uncharacterized membrane protein YeaQ/YmgE (transglycosylase-associated protein family)
MPRLRSIGPAGVAGGLSAAAQASAKGVVVMGFISWIVFGLIAGFIGSKLVNKEGQGFLMNVVLGILGAVVGGYIGTLLGLGGVSGFNFGSLLLAIGGAVVVQVIYRAFTGSSRL